MPITDPTSISGCLLWGDSDNAKFWQDTGRTVSALVAGNPVASWQDSSGNGNHITTATAGKRPLVTAYGSRWCLAFDNVDDGLGTALSLANPCSVGIIYAYDSATSGTHRAATGSNNWLIGPYNGSYNAFNAAFLPLGGVGNGTVVRSVFTGASTGGFHYQNDQASTSNANTTAPGTFGLAAFTGAAFAEPLNGRIMEVVAYNKVLSATERSDLDAYWVTKYSFPAASRIADPGRAAAGAMTRTFGAVLPVASSRPASGLLYPRGSGTIRST